MFKKKKKDAIDLFVDSFCEVMLTEHQRISGNDPSFVDYNQITDRESGVKIDLRSKTNCVMYIPGNHHSFKLTKKNIRQLKAASKQMEQNQLLDLRVKLFDNGGDDYSKYLEIKKFREQYPMVEDAYQNLLTVYALHADKNTKNISGEKS